MDYQGDIYRPPAEANSILLQVTCGCAHNRCSFCEMYRHQPFRVKKMATIIADINEAAHRFSARRKLFLCDGDALAMPHQELVKVLTTIGDRLPGLARISTYASVRSAAKKSDSELAELVSLGLTMAYVGIESGDDLTLAAINKGADSATMITQCARLHKAGFKLSLTVILGIAGVERSAVHAAETGRVLSAIDPRFAAALTLMLTPATPLYAAWRAGRFDLPGPRRILGELQQMIAATDLSGGLFHANHASNYLPITARLPRDKERVLTEIDAALRGERALKADCMRGL